MNFKRWLAASSAAVILTATAGASQSAQARDIVGFAGGYSAGTVVVKTGERSLYYVLGDGKAVRYSVGVGRAGKQWTGTSIITGKYLKPAWTPPAEVKRDKPNLPNVIPGGTGRNPMGARCDDFLERRRICDPTAPTNPARSVVPCRTAASGCTTTTSSISTIA